MDRFWVRLGATFFFTGYFPVAPATFGSFVTLGLWWFLPPMSWIVQLLLIAVIGVAGLSLSTRAESIFGHDGRPIVIDEVVGCLITVFMLPHTLGVAVVGFLLFRVFDVVKPPPAYQLQSLRAGAGVMADDVMAGIYANVALRIVLFFWPALG